MEMNYFNQLLRNYPEKKELFRWIHASMDAKIYLYGPNYRNTEDFVSHKTFKSLLVKYYHFFKYNKKNYKNAIICEAYFNVGNFLSQNGYKVLLPPWLTGVLSKDAMEVVDVLNRNKAIAFNVLVSKSFEENVYRLKDELKNFFLINKIPFVLLANGEQPINRIVIDLCKEISIPTGVFLHGLPARYGLEDDYHPDYFFVWGKKIKENFQKIGFPSNIVVTGNPAFSHYSLCRKTNEKIVVLTQAISYPHCSNGYLISDVGMTIQYIYTVEKVLKSLGYNQAVLRPHPGENPDWYRQRMDTHFYSIDNNSLEETLSSAKFIIGPISTVILNAVFSNIPYYVYIIDSTTNRNAPCVVPPFSDADNTSVSHSEEELLYNIKNRKSANKENFSGYVDELFDVSKILSCIKQK